MTETPAQETGLDWTDSGFGWVEWKKIFLFGFAMLGAYGAGLPFSEFPTACYPVVQSGRTVCESQAVYIGGDEETTKKEAEKHRMIMESYAKHGF